MKLTSEPRRGMARAPPLGTAPSRPPSQAPPRPRPPCPPPEARPGLPPSVPPPPTPPALPRPPTHVAAPPGTALGSATLERAVPPPPPAGPFGTPTPPGSLKGTTSSVPNRGFGGGEKGGWGALRSQMQASRVSTSCPRRGGGPGRPWKWYGRHFPCPPPPPRRCGSHSRFQESCVFLG